MAIVSIGRQEVHVAELTHHKQDHVTLEVHEGELHPHTVFRVVLTTHSGRQTVREMRLFEMLKEVPAK